jgi:hypothetical protein
LAHADESADWVVDEDCVAPCAWPEPPQPNSQLELLVWLCVADCVVSAELDAVDVAELSRDWLAELSPPYTSPPAIETGTLALTPFCLAPACESAD